MKITIDQLTGHLRSKHAKPVYWISSDEPLLRNEAADQIRDGVRQSGFESREKFVVDARFDWQPLLATLQAPSLFAQKKRLELDFTLVKLNKSHTDGLMVLLSELQNHPQCLSDNFILIVSQKLEARHTQSSWYKQLLTLGAHLPIWPIARQQLPQWIQSRFKVAGLNSSIEVAIALADQVEGNLLAAQQEIEKLALLYGHHYSDPSQAASANTPRSADISLAHLQQAISDRAQYSTFDFVDAILAGEPDQSVRRLNRLKDTGAEPVLILWALTKEIRALIRGSIISAQHGQSLNDWYRQERILPAKQKLAAKALSRLNRSPLEQALAMCHIIDLAIKGRSKLCPWLGLEQLATSIASNNFDAVHQHLAVETESIAY